MDTVRKIGITDTILRDAHQSLIATRMRLEDMLPAAQALDAAGYYSLEVWGGATFDVCLRYLNECPWERLRSLRKALPNTRLQMLLRGQNLVGYRHYADDVVDAFVDKARECGIDIFRIFDALNDIRNLTRAMHRARAVGGIVEGSISYTVSPVHTIEQFVAFASRLKDEGADIICIKDMAGMISPASAFDLISALKSEVGLPVHLHTHCASGQAPATYLRAAQAGADIVDCALSPFSWGTSQPPTESIAAMFAEGGFSTGMDLARVFEAATHFQKVRERYSAILNPRSERVDTQILMHQIPGGMLSNLLSQLEMQKASARLPEVLEETARVRKDLGYPPLVTPTSQIVGTQAVFNVLAGARYQMISQEVKEYCRGMYGRPPAPIDPELAGKAVGDASVVACRPADLLKPEMEASVAAVAPYSTQRHDALSHALFPQVALAFLKARHEGKAPATTEPPPEQARKKQAEVTAARTGDRTYRISLGGTAYSASVAAAKASGADKLTVTVDGKAFDVTLEAVAARRAGKAGGADTAASSGTIVAPMPGMVVRILKKVGDTVQAGDVVALLEAMKMQNEIRCKVAGVVRKVSVEEGASIDKGTPILHVS